MTASPRTPPLRIAFVTPEFVTEPYWSGGLASYLHRTARALTEDGSEVVVVTRSSEEPSRLVFDGIEVHRVPTGRASRLASALTRRRLADSASDLDFSWQAYRLLRRLHGERPFDVVQSANSRACGLATRWLLPVPHAVRVSCYRPLWNDLAGVRRSPDSRAQEWLEALHVGGADAVFAPSRSMCELLAREGVTDTARVLRSPFYLETGSWDDTVRRSLGDAPYLLFFGRLQLHKGFPVLVEALPRFLEAHPEAQVVFAGLDLPTPLAPSMRDWALDRLAGFRERLVFPGALRHEQLYPVIADASVVVLPSLAENLPNAGLEAMALGRAVVGTAGTSFEELIEDGESGFLVQPGDPDALAEALDGAWTHPDRDRIGKSAALRVRDFAPDRTVGEHRALYRSLRRGRSLPVDFADRVADFIARTRAGRTGEHGLCPGAAPTLYASCFAAMSLHYLGRLERLSDGERSHWAAYLNEWQDPVTGWYRGLELAGALDSADHDLEHLQLHLTAHVLPTLALLGERPAHPLRAARAFLDPEHLRTWLDRRDFRKAWLEGNNLLFVGQLLVHLRDVEGEPAAQPALDLWFDWLDSRVDPATGLWGTDGSCDAYEALYGGYHPLLLYCSERRPLRHGEQLLDLALSLQHPDGGFAPAAGGGACEDVDAVDVIANVHRRTGRRPRAVRLALERAVQAVQRRQTADGGFVYRAGEPFTYMGMERVAAPADTGQLFATWFALHTLALASAWVPAARLPDTGWRFNERGSMGWHDPEVGVPSRPDPWVDRLPAVAYRVRTAARHARRSHTLTVRRRLGSLRRCLLGRRAPSPASAAEEG